MGNLTRFWMWNGALMLKLEERLLLRYNSAFKLFHNASLPILNYYLYFMELGIVKLSNSVFYARHGVMDEEHRIGGRYEVDVTLKVDFEKPAQTDNLKDTADYGKVYALVREIVLQNSFYLIEKIAYLISHEILRQLPLVHQAKVTVRKVNPPVGGTCDKAEAIFSAKRELE